jgi:hypothetical protein
LLECRHLIERTIQASYRNVNSRTVVASLSVLNRAGTQHHTLGAVR